MAAELVLMEHFLHEELRILSQQDFDFRFAKRSVKLELFRARVLLFHRFMDIFESMLDRNDPYFDVNDNLTPGEIKDNILGKLAALKSIVENLPVFSRFIQDVYASAKNRVITGHLERFQLENLAVDVTDDYHQLGEGQILFLLKELENAHSCVRQAQSDCARSCYRAVRWSMEGLRTLDEGPLKMFFKEDVAHELALITERGLQVPVAKKLLVADKSTLVLWIESLAYQRKIVQ